MAWSLGRHRHGPQSSTRKGADTARPPVRAGRRRTSSRACRGGRTLPSFVRSGRNSADGNTIFRTRRRSDFHRCTSSRAGGRLPLLRNRLRAYSNGVADRSKVMPHPVIGLLSRMSKLGGRRRSRWPVPLGSSCGWSKCLDSIAPKGTRGLFETRRLDEFFDALNPEIQAVRERLDPKVWTDDAASSLEVY